jgi:hypothetical protein
MACVDFAFNAAQRPPFSLYNTQSPMAGYVQSVPNLIGKPGGPLYQTSLSFPVRGDSVTRNDTFCPATRPLDDQFNGFTQNGLFIGQSHELMSTRIQIAEDADGALPN